LRNNDVEFGVRAWKHEGNAVTDALVADRTVNEAEDGFKRAQIVEGAREIFLARGFDAASMGDIAKAAGVSKGTLYVYFKNKEELFAAIVQQECCTHAEGVFGVDENDPDVEGALTRIGGEFVNFLCRPEKAASIRIVIAIAERMPEIGKAFYETGPGNGIARVKAYLEAQIRAGVLEIDDCEVVAAQFLESCQATLFKPVLFNFGPPPTPEQIRHVVRIAARTLVAAYKK
jgi:AcrR family transcriptional regulator